MSGNGQVHFSDYIAQHKFEGCKASEKVERYLELKIPTDQTLDYMPEEMSLSDTSVAKGLTGSHHGRVVKVNYTLKVFVKHEGWNSWGEGNSVLIPVKILQPATQVEFAMPKIQAPPYWNPVVCQERHFGEHKEKVATHYHDTYVLPDLRKWTKPDQPENRVEKEKKKAK